MTVLDGDNSSCSVAGIPRRRHVHGHQHRLAKNGYNLTSDTRYFLAKTREEIARVGRKIVAVFGESVSVSASWNASYTARRVVSIKHGHWQRSIDTLWVPLPLTPITCISSINVSRHVQSSISSFWIYYQAGWFANIHGTYSMLHCTKERLPITSTGNNSYT